MIGEGGLTGRHVAVRAVHQRASRMICEASEWRRIWGVWVLGEDVGDRPRAGEEGLTLRGR